VIVRGLKLLVLCFLGGAGVLVFVACVESAVDAIGSPRADGGSCEEGQWCSGQCVDITLGPENCGACGERCSAGQHCSLGFCVCANDEILCEGGCTRSSVNPANCGACERACDVGEVCNVGTCGIGCDRGLRRPVCGSDERPASLRWLWHCLRRRTRLQLRSLPGYVCRRRNQLLGSQRQRLDE
jgi:hypothetical protein